jgi:hypothetical protein
MHSAEPYGHLCTATGVPITTVEHLARIVGENAKDVRKWLGELESAQVFSRTETGIIFSRRMVRDAEGRHAWNERQSRARSRVRHALDNGDVTQVSRRSHTTKGKGKGKRDTENASGAKAPSDSLLPDFGDLEPEISAFLEAAAAVNRSGKITPGRTLAVRRELLEALSRVGDRGAFAYGLREAVKRGIGNVNYAVKASSSFTPLMSSTEEPSREIEILDPIPESVINGAS